MQIAWKQKTRMEETPKEWFDSMVGELLSDRMVPGEVVIPYARERLQRLQRDLMCQKVNSSSNIFEETKSKYPDAVIRVEEGWVAPLANESSPRDFPGKIHNYVLFCYWNPKTGAWETAIEFLRMNFLEVRSKHAHIILTKIYPRYGTNFRYIVSGECVFDQDSGILTVNVQSGMNWELNLSRPDTMEWMDSIRDSLPEDIRRGRGPKNDVWGAIIDVYFQRVLGFPRTRFGTSTLRGKTSEKRSVIQSQWCSEGVVVEEYPSLNDCMKRSNGKNLCRTEEPLEVNKDEEGEGDEEEIDLESFTVPELREILKEMGIPVVGRPRKAELIEMIEDGIE